MAERGHLPTEGPSSKRYLLTPCYVPGSVPGIGTQQLVDTASAIMNLSVWNIQRIERFERLVRKASGSFENGQSSPKSKMMSFTVESQ